MTLIPVKIFSQQFTTSEAVFLAALADHVYTDGQLIIGNTATGGISFATLTQGTGVTITNGNGTITIDAAASSGLTVGTTTITSGTNTRVLFDNSGVLGEYTISGTGNVAMTTSPVFTTPTLGVASATSVNRLTITTPATGSTLTIIDGKTLTVNKTMSLTAADDTGVYTLPTGTKTLLATDGAGTSLTGIPYTLTGTANQVILSAGTGNITFTLPQSIGTASAVSFASLATSAASPLLLTNGQLVTIALTGQTTGATTLTIPDFASVVDEFVFKTKSVTMSNKTFVAPVLGAATATSINGLIVTATAGTLTIANNASASLITSGNFALTLTSTNTTNSTFPAGTHTLAGLDVAQAFTAVQTITNITLPDQGQIKLTVPTTDLKATGFTTSDFNSGYSSTAIGDLVYLDSSATWQKCDANTLALYNGLLGIALTVTASGAAATVALPGTFIYSTTGFPTWTIGSPIYMSETAGAMTHTAPTTTDAATRVVGWGVHADKMYFFPSPDYITHT